MDGHPRSRACIATLPGIRFGPHCGIAFAVAASTDHSRQTALVRKQGNDASSVPSHPWRCARVGFGSVASNHLMKMVYFTDRDNQRLATHSVRRPVVSLYSSTHEEVIRGSLGSEGRFLKFRLSILLSNVFAFDFCFQFLLSNHRF